MFESRFLNRLAASRMVAGAIAFVATLAFVGLTADRASAVACTPGTVGVPTIALSKQIASESLLGDEIPVSLTASEPIGETYSGYNLTFREVLPAGFRYKPGSSAVAPQVIDDQPLVGQQTLIFSNVSDLAPGSDFTLRFTLVQTLTGPDAVEVGDVLYTGPSEAFVNCDPQRVPRFDSLGFPVSGANSYSSSTLTLDKPTTITALDVTKSEPSLDGELMRGLHEHQTVYTVGVRNNSLNPTTGVQVEDYLPAGLEYLGCATTDNTIDAPTNPGSPEEYPGSGPINPGNAPTFAKPCLPATTVETVSLDPDGAGPAPSGIYTHVVFDLSGDPDFTPGELFEFQYAAAIPICPNTLDWNGAGAGDGTPPPTAGQQESNLDNNSCGLVGETIDETSLTNYAIARGDYQSDLGPVPITDFGSTTVSAEDLALHKSVNTGVLAIGSLSTWTMRVRTSEYRTFQNTEIDDVLPDGYCPVDATTNYESTPPPANPECDGTGDPADDPTINGVPATYSFVTEQADGSWMLGFDLTSIDSNEDFLVTFKSRTRAFYQDNFDDDRPLLADDTLTNSATTTGDNQPICSDPVLGVVPCPGGPPIFHTQTPGLPVSDGGSASQTGALPSLSKTVREPGGAVPVDCTTGTYVDKAVGLYGPGDVVCWQLHVDFPSGVDTSGITLTDFLPPGSDYAAADQATHGAGPMPGNDFPGATITDQDTFLSIDLGVATVPDGGLSFDWIIATRIDNVNPNGDPADLPDLRGNLLKMSTTNSAGQVTTYRADAEFDFASPLLTLTKGVQSINGLPAGGNPPDTDGGIVIGGDVVTYRIDLDNSGLLDAQSAVVHERMIGPYNCTMLSNISNGGSCSTTGFGPTAETTISWDAADAISVNAGGSTTLTFDFTVPGTVAPFTQIDDNACLDAYGSGTNAAPGDEFTLVPDNPPADCGTPPGTPNVPAAADASFVSTGGTFAKTRSTSVVENNNNSAQATIGETIDYTIAFTVPANTTVYNGQITDTISAPTRQAYVAGSVDCELFGSPDACGSGDLAGFVASESGNVVTLDFPATVINATTSAQVYYLTFSTVVVDIGSNVANGTLANTARLNQDSQYAVPVAERSASSPNTRIVEPNPQVVKANDDADDVVNPNQEIQYTVTVTNPARTTPAIASSPAHDVVVEDTVPAGLTPSDGNGAALADGASVVTCTGAATAVAGIWDTATRTITWNIPIVLQSDSIALPYCVDVDDDPVAGLTLTNYVDLTATSLSGVVTGERSYTDSTSSAVTVAGASTTKSASPTVATVGTLVTYTATLTLPANLQFYDLNVVDALPAGADFVSFVSFTCISGCPPTPAPPTTSQSGNTLTWSFGDVAPHVAARTLEFVYTARVTDVVGNQDGTILSNAVDANWRLSPGPGLPDVTTNQVTSDVTVREPDVTIDKDVSGQSGDTDARDTQPGDSYTYTLTVANTGNWPAEDVVVNDTPSSTLLNVTPVTGAGQVTTAWAAPGDPIVWTIPTIPAGGSVTLTYTAELAASINLTQGQTVVNTAEVSEYWAYDETTRSANPTVDYREYPEGANPSDTVTLTVQLPQLSIAKTTGAGTESGDAELGQPFTWRVVVSNTSAYASASDVDLTDTLPAGWTYVPGSATIDLAPLADPSISGQDLTWSDVGDLAPGASYIVRFDATPTLSALDIAGEPTNPYVNSALVTALDADGANASGDGPYSATDNAEADILMPILGIEKTPDAGTAVAGTTTNFTIQVENTGSGTARDVVVTDLLPDGLAYTAGTATAVGGVNFSETSVTPDPPNPTEIVWHFDSIAPGSSATITLPVFVPADTPDATVFVNDVAVRSFERPTDVTDTGQITTSLETDREILKDDNAAVVDAGESISYTLSASNNGPSDASSMTVTDSIDTADFDFVSITPTDSNDSCVTSGAPVDLVTCTISGPIAPGSPAHTFTLVLMVKSGTTGSVSNTAQITGPETDTNPFNDESTVVTPIGTLADLTVVKSVSAGQPSTILNHDQTEFTVTVENAGPSDAVDVDLTDQLPAGLSCVSASGPGTLSGCDGLAGDTVVFSDFDVVSGATATFTIVVRGEVVGTQNNVATVTDSVTPLVTPNPTDDADVVVDPMADLGVTKTGPATATSGSQISYTLVTTNNGPDTAVDAQLVDILPVGFSYVSHTTDTGSCAFATGSLICDFGDMAATAVATVTLIVDVGYSYSDQTATNEVDVTSKTPDTIPANNHDELDTAIGPNADVAITKAGPAYGAVGYPLTYTLSVVNNGPATADDVIVTDVLPAGLTFDSATSNVGSCSEAAGTVSCTLGDMALGATAQITITSVPDASLENTTITNTATVATSTPDPDLSNNSSSVNTPVEANSFPTSSDLVLTKTVSNAAPAVGDTLTYTISVLNNGPADAPSTVVTDTLPSGLIFVSAGGNGVTCANAGQVVTCQLGTVAAGATTSFTVTTIVTQTGAIQNTASATSPNDRNPANNFGFAPIDAQASRAVLSITKRANRSLVRVGGSVTFRITVKNVSKTTAVRLRTCDLVPSRLTVIRRGGGTLSGGNLCWTRDSLGPGKSVTYKVTMRVTNGRGASVTNPARVTAGNAATKRAKAKIAVPRIAPRTGGTTG